MQLKDLGNLSNALNNLNSSNNIAEYFNSLDLGMQRCVLTSKKLSEAQLGTILSGTTFMENNDGIKVSISGLEQSEMKATLSTTVLSTPKMQQLYQPTVLKQHLLKVHLTTS
jgi:hypothetical protein